jgi:hypothetical protein
MAHEWDAPHVVRPVRVCPHQRGDLRVVQWLRGTTQHRKNLTLTVTKVDVGKLADDIRREILQLLTGGGDGNPQPRAATRTLARGLSWRQRFAHAQAQLVAVSVRAPFRTLGERPRECGSSPDTAAYACVFRQCSGAFGDPCPGGGGMPQALQVAADRIVVRPAAHAALLCPVRATTSATVGDGPNSASIASARRPRSVNMYRISLWSCEAPGRGQASSPFGKRSRTWLSVAACPYSPVFKYSSSSTAVACTRSRIRT